MADVTLAEMIAELDEDIAFNEREACDPTSADERRQHIRCETRALLRRIAEPVSEEDAIRAMATWIGRPGASRVYMNGEERSSMLALLTEFIRRRVEG